MDVYVFKDSDKVTQNSTFEQLIKEKRAFILPKLNWVIIDREFLDNIENINSGIINREDLNNQSSANTGAVILDTKFYNLVEVDIIFKRYERYSTHGYNIFFIDCKFNFNEKLHYNPLKTKVQYIWHRCEIKNISIEHVGNSNSTSTTQAIDLATNLDNSFFNCKIKRFIFFSDLPTSPFYISNCKVDIISTNAQTIRFKLLTTKLIHHFELHTKPDYGFDNVKIEYDKQLLSELKANEFPGYLNSIRQLYLNDGLYSERNILEQYLNFFKSRDNKLLRFFYWFNGGYYNLPKPTITTVGIIALMTLITSSIFNKNSLIFSFYPVEMFKSIILDDFCQTDLIVFKIILTFLEIIYIYSTFSLLAAIRKRLGFKIV
jgi:hypothetical protein